MNPINGKTAFITGGNTGIGFGIAQILVKAGMNVAITSRSLSKAQQAAEQLNQLNSGKALGLECDVREYKSQHKAIEQALSQFGTIDCLVANAGMGYFAPIQEMEIDKWNEVIDTNLTGVFYSIKACLPALQKSKGYVITISSLAGTNFFPTASAYNASKFGLTGFTQSVMLDLRNDGIKVSTIMPGSVTSNFNGHEPSAKDAWKIQPEDIGKLVKDLLEMNPRTLPSKIEVRPSQPPSN